MIHFTVNTGQRVTQNLDQVPAIALDPLRPLLAAGVGQLPAPLAAYRVEIDRDEGCTVFSIFRAREPLPTCGLAWTEAGADEVWPALEELYLNMSVAVAFEGMDSEPNRPASLPWLAVVFMPLILFPAGDDIRWFGDFELCLAAVILKRAV